MGFDAEVRIGRDGGIVCARDTAPVDAQKERRLEPCRRLRVAARRDRAQLTGVIAVTDIGVVRPITTSPTLIFFSMSWVAIDRAV